MGPGVLVWTFKFCCLPPDRRDREMDRGEVKHIVLVKFKDGVSPQQIDHIIKTYANLVNLIQPMNSFRWGKDVSIENLQQGFTHVFESTFDSEEGIAEYLSHPALAHCGDTSIHLDKVLVVDYKPITLNL